MPRPARPCSVVTCPHARPCPVHGERKPFATAHRSTELYQTLEWRQRRAAQLAAHPNCVECARVGRITPATVADHVEPHHGNAVRFWSGALQSLCMRHSNEKTGRETRARR